MLAGRCGRHGAHAWSLLAGPRPQTDPCLWRSLQVMLEHVEGLVVGSQGVVHQVLRSERGASGFLAQHCIATKGTGARQQRSRSGLQRVRLGR